MTEDNSPEPVPEWVAKVRAIGVDTNAVGRGTYNSAELGELARQARQHGYMELWIAEPVVWEWAEHLHEARTQFNAQRKILTSAGIEVEAQSTEIQDALQHVESAIAALGDHVKIISIEHVAREALKDQILVQAPGEHVRTNGSRGATATGRKLKTGAADSAIYRAYHHQAGGSGESYVVFSGDSDVEKAHKTWGYAVRTYRDRRRLGDELFRMIQAPENLVWECVRYLRNNLNLLDLTSFSARTNLGGWASDDRIVSFAGTGNKLLVGLTGPRLDKRAQIVTAEACILTNVHSAEYGYDPNEEGLQLSGSQPRAYPDTAVYVDVTFSVDNGSATDVNMGAVSFASVNEAVEEIEDEDGPLRILENMTNIPGLARFDWADSFWEDTDITVVVEGDQLHLEFVGSAAADWTLTATYRAQWIEVSGQQQHDGADLGVITFPGTARLFANSSLAPNHPSFAVNALVMNAPKLD